MFFTRNLKGTFALKSAVLLQGMVVHAFNPSTWRAEAGGSLNSKPAWSTERVPGQPGLHGETLSQKNKSNNNNKTKTQQQNKQTNKKSRKVQ